MYLFFGSKASFGTTCGNEIAIFSYQRGAKIHNFITTRSVCLAGKREGVHFVPNPFDWGQKWDLWSDLQWIPHWTHLFGAFGRLPPSHPSTKRWFGVFGAVRDRGRVWEVCLRLVFWCCEWQGYSLGSFPAIGASMSSVIEAEKVFWKRVMRSFEKIFWRFLRVWFFALGLWFFPVRHISMKNFCFFMCIEVSRVWRPGVQRWGGSQGWEGSGKVVAQFFGSSRSYLFFLWYWHDPIAWKIP